MTVCQCGAEETGSFCSKCGANLNPEPCPACKETPSAGAQFCNHCGAELRTKAGAASASEQGGPNLGWWAAGIMTIIVAFLMLVPVLRPETEAPLPATAPIPTGPASVDLSSMTPREAADRLFERVMTAVSEENGEEVRGFLPMAVQAYSQVPNLDADGFFHMAILRQVEGSPAGAFAAAEAGLELSPNHLLALAAAAGAAETLGNAATARELHLRFLENYDSEIASENQDYLLHQQLLPGMKEAAEAYLAGGGA